MIIIGCDYHPGSQQIAFVDTDTGEFQERELGHCEAAEKFYRDLAALGVKVRVGMEASGHARWFERLMAELSVELWMGDAAKIRAKRVRKKKTKANGERNRVACLVPMTRFLLSTGTQLQPHTPTRRKGDAEVVITLINIESGLLCGSSSEIGEHCCVAGLG